MKTILLLDLFLSNFQLMSAEASLKITKYKKSTYSKIMQYIKTIYVPFIGF